jgi:hypothetical protein
VPHRGMSDSGWFAVGPWPEWCRISLRRQGDSVGLLCTVPALFLPFVPAFIAGSSSSVGPATSAGTGVVVVVGTGVVVVVGTGRGRCRDGCGGDCGDEVVSSKQGSVPALSAPLLSRPNPGLCSKPGRLIIASITNARFSVPWTPTIRHFNRTLV